MIPAQKKTSSWFNVETIIVLMIAGCMIFLINFANTKLDEVISSDNEALLIQHDPTSKIHQELAEEILNFRPDACKMIEVYTEDFEPMVRVQFKKDHVHDDDIKKYPDLIAILKSAIDGHTNVIIDDQEEDIYFRWTNNTSTGDPYLFIIYMSRPVVHNLWVFPFVCYLILILIGILLIRLHLKAGTEKIRNYHMIMNSRSDNTK